jgi:hypothetical protein
MKSSECNLFDECFTHVDGNVQTTWNATQVYQWCVDHNIEVVRTPVDLDQAQWLIENRGVEAERIERLKKAPPEVIARPVVFIYDQTDDSHILLVDGTHRYVLLAGWRIPYIRTYIVEREMVKQFIIEDSPEMSNDELMGPSLLNAIRMLFGDR